MTVSPYPPAVSSKCPSPEVAEEGSVYTRGPWGRRLLRGLMLSIIRVVTLFFGHCIVICREMIDMFGIMGETCLKVPRRFSCLPGQNSICLGYPPVHSIWQSLAKKKQPMMHSDFLALYWLDPYGRSAGQRCLHLEKLELFAYEWPTAVFILAVNSSIGLFSYLHFLFLQSGSDCFSLRSNPLMSR